MKYFTSSHLLDSFRPDIAQSLVIRPIDELPLQSKLYCGALAISQSGAPPARARLEFSPSHMDGEVGMWCCGGGGPLSARRLLPPHSAYVCMDVRALLLRAIKLGASKARVMTFSERRRRSSSDWHEAFPGWPGPSSTPSVRGTWPDGIPQKLLYLCAIKGMNLSLQCGAAVKTSQGCV